MAAIFNPELKLSKMIFHKYGYVLYRWIAHLMLIHILIGNKGPNVLERSHKSLLAKCVNFMKIALSSDIHLFTLEITIPENRRHLCNLVYT